VSDWSRIQVQLLDPDDRVIDAEVNYLPGRPANLRGDPDGWTPAEGDEAEILSATYEDGSPVPAAILKQIDDEFLINRIHEQFEDERSSASRY